jgi:hypothetical protein
MSLYVNRLRPSLKAILGRLGLLPAAGRSQHLIRLATNPEYRRREHRRDQRFQQFKRQYADVLRHRLNSADHEPKRALVVSFAFPEVQIELGLIKALELAGFAPIVLIPFHDRLLMDYYKLASINEAYFLSEFTDPPDEAAAEATIERFQSVDELLTFESAGVHIGRIAVSTALRRHRLASLDLKSPQDRRVLVEHVAWSMASSTAAQRVLRRVQPELALLVDGVYTPVAELFDSCLLSGTEVIWWNFAHKSNTLMLKRYALENKSEHPVSLSSESWRLLCAMGWTDAHREQLQRELRSTYASGDWYSIVDTQFNKRLMDAEEIRKELGLDPAKKTAFIFPHILWDASLGYGRGLFQNYAEWFVESVRAACANDQLNWVIKIHPAHVGKGVREGFREEPAEVVLLRERIGELPSHVSLIPADSEISTFSLFDLMDYCLTVRGTVGIEAARLGIPVLTAGTGRYDHKGFTIDSESREQYLERVAHIQTIPRLSPAQQELAERYAYGLFVLRPLPLETVTVQSRDHKSGLNNYRINIGSKEEWYSASDLRAFAEWLTESRQPDFLMPPPPEEQHALLPQAQPCVPLDS